MDIRIVEQGKQDELNTQAIYACCWTNGKGKVHGSSWGSEARAREIAVRQIERGRTNVFIKKVWCAGFVI